MWRWGEEGDRLYTYRYTVTIRMTSALTWAAMRAILMFHNCEGQSHKTVSTDHNSSRERTAETDSNRDRSSYQPNALPLGQTGSLAKHAIIKNLSHQFQNTGNLIPVKSWITVFDTTVNSKRDQVKNTNKHLPVFTFYLSTNGDGNNQVDCIVL